jgi:small-conductance mechanosensitive channel
VRAVKIPLTSSLNSKYLSTSLHQKKRKGRISKTMAEVHQMWEIAGIDVTQIVEIVIVLAATYLTARIVHRTLRKIFEKTPFPEEIENWIVKISKYVVYIIGVFVVLSVANFDLTSIIVGLGAFSIAISFAMSNIIQNFVSGIIVQSDRAFKVGDEIQVRIAGKEYEGKVVKMRIRTTIIKTKDGDKVSIPNSAFITNPVIKKKKTSKKFSTN